MCMASGEVEVKLATEGAESEREGCRCAAVKEVGVHSTPLHSAGCSTHRRGETWEKGGVTCAQNENT